MSTDSFKSGTFTGNLNNANLTITYAMGLRYLSVKVSDDSSADGTIEGNKPQLGSLQSSAVTLTPGAGLTITASGTTILSGIELTAPSGCTIEIVAR